MRNEDIIGFTSIAIIALTIFRLFWLPAFILRKNTPWRVVRRINKYGGEDFRIQQKWLGKWWTTYTFSYGCNDPVALEKSFRETKAKQTHPRIEVIQEYKPVDAKPKPAKVAPKKRNKRRI